MRSASVRVGTLLITCSSLLLLLLLLILHPAADAFSVASFAGVYSTNNAPRSATLTTTRTSSRNRHHVPPCSSKLFSSLTGTDDDEAGSFDPDAADLTESELRQFFSNWLHGNATLVDKATRTCAAPQRVP